ncbi:helix-turn-helix domain-containing protein [Micromonospora sp. STR1s_6]|uniref:Helix-turn-helix domain-containing protein n=1 Tax=Micromonospora tarensis TaxID=2806100 RepID=A0ABS1YGE2_9ACTN|nr:helix-turn-helix domain-containing protein [Micromonospora tarensis]
MKANPAAEYLTPDIVADARRLLGARLAATRKGVGVTQVRLARLVRWSRSTVANVETARQFAPHEFWIACDVALGAGGLLVAEWERTEALSHRLREQTVTELVRQRLTHASPMCVCRDLRRLLRLADSLRSPGISSTASAEGDGAGHG